MDDLQYEQYSSVVSSGAISLEALKRIVAHDRASGWDRTPGGLARKKVVKDCLAGTIDYKLKDKKGDLLYGVKWPLPLNFELSEGR